VFWSWERQVNRGSVTAMSHRDEVRPSAASVNGEVNGCSS
jgi:hypothetical protein